MRSSRQDGSKTREMVIRRRGGDNVWFESEATSSLQPGQQQPEQQPQQQQWQLHCCSSSRIHSRLSQQIDLFFLACQLALQKFNINDVFTQLYILCTDHARMKYYINPDSSSSVLNTCWVSNYVSMYSVNSKLRVLGDHISGVLSWCIFIFVCVFWWFSGGFYGGILPQEIAGTITKVCKQIYISQRTRKNNTTSKTTDVSLILGKKIIGEWSWSGSRGVPCWSTVKLLIFYTQ